MPSLLENIGLLVKTRVQEIMIQEAFDAGELASSVTIEIDKRENSVTIGSPLHRAVYNEFGTGQRGAENFKSYLGEKAPHFTVPIVSKTGKVLAWVTKGHTRPTSKEGWKAARKAGYARFAKSTKGMKPAAPFRRALFENRSAIAKLIKEDIEQGLRGELIGNGNR